jgi:hypothetical protein
MLNASASLIPTFVVILGIVLDYLSSNSLRGELNNLSKEVSKLIDDLKQTNHKDALEIMRQMTALHERVAVVEAKQK